MSVSAIQREIGAGLIQEKPPICDVITSIALNVFKDIVAGAVCGAIAACFIGGPSGLMLIASAFALQTIVSIVFHSLGAFAAYQELPTLQSSCEWVEGGSFALLSGFNVQTVIHELGHTLAASLIYKRPRPMIEISPFSGGFTQFYKTALSPFGQQLGASASTCFILAAGPGLTLLASSALFTLGLVLHEEHSQLGKYLISWGALDFLNHAVYAYSALGAESWHLHHDFVHLSIFGLHPVAATIGILSIPLFITLAHQHFRDR